MEMESSEVISFPGACAGFPAQQGMTFPQCAITVLCRQS
jgi:hypothetical protein